MNRTFKKLTKIFDILFSKLKVVKAFSYNCRWNEKFGNWKKLFITFSFNFTTENFIVASSQIKSEISDVTLLNTDVEYIPFFNLTYLVMPPSISSKPKALFQSTVRVLCRWKACCSRRPLNRTVMDIHISFNGSIKWNVAMANTPVDATKAQIVFKLHSTKRQKQWL